MILNILSIAGSDPSGGAGIQADLKTFSALGAYGMAAITALTAQNTTGVSAVYELPPEFVSQQLEAVFSDIRVDAVKIGMAGSPETIGAIAAALLKFKPCYVVLDPVIAAQSGDRLVTDAAINAIKRHLIPLATIMTPNIPEAAILMGRPVGDDLQEAAKHLLTLGAPAVLLKGGHLEGPISIDVYADTEWLEIFEGPRIKTQNNHGTGCALSSALAVCLAQAMELPEACRAAKQYVAGALRRSGELQVGHGNGPVNHFHELWKKN